MLYAIFIIIIIGSIIAIFSKAFEDVENKGNIFIRVIAYIPTLIIGAILLVAGDFKNHRLGYTVLIIIVCVIITVIILGIRSDPSIPSEVYN